MASFLAIFPLCAWRHLEIIETDLYERSQAALSEAGIAGVEITVRGRDLLLVASEGEDQLDQAVGALRDVYGVHRIRLGDTQGAGEGGN